MASKASSLGTLLSQLRLPFVTPREPGRPSVTVGGRTYTVAIARHRRARRYVLRLADDETLRLTVPRGASIAGGLRFAERQREWIERERARTRARQAPWAAGTQIMWRGEIETLKLTDTHILCGPERIPRPRDTGDLRLAVEKHLRASATRELEGRCDALAEIHGFRVTRISVRQVRSRWGSCSPKGAVMLNWRLMQMPEFVMDYVICHELAHFEQPNHSRRFWRVVDRLYPKWREAERWLRRHGREIL